MTAAELSETPTQVPSVVSHAQVSRRRCKIREMSEPMDVDPEISRGVKRKADELSVVTAPRRIEASFKDLSIYTQPNVLKGT